MFRFLESLSIQHGVANRTYHLLLAHFLQSAYPSVQDVNNAFNISSVAQGTFSFAPRTAIVVNLELMCELQALQGRGVLNKYTFADAVLRSVPNYLVQGLCHLLEPANAAGAAHRAKLISDGKQHMFSFVLEYFCVAEISAMVQLSGLHLIANLHIVCYKMFHLQAPCT